MGDSTHREEASDRLVCNDWNIVYSRPQKRTSRIYICLSTGKEYNPKAEFMLDLCVSSNIKDTY